ncbi:MAG TPA: C4-type zinc ribbon domain-containing protein [Dehalococcoidia bacterium]|nr:C4-type zinc ribbon domain-containing protein [Dehalococcoidia bacterium]
MIQISDLVRLQETDTALDSRRASLEDAESRLGESEEVESERLRVQGLRESLRAARSSQRDIEAEADALRAKIAPEEEKLYSGAIKNPRELSDLQDEVDQLKRHLAQVEDRNIEAMSGVEQAEAELNAAEQHLAALEAEWQAEQRALTEKINRLRAEIASYEEQRAERSSYVDDETLRRYEHIRRAHQGRGVAQLDRNLCTGCRISLPVSIVNRARSGSTIVQCPNCERILYS